MSISSSPLPLIQHLENPKRQEWTNIFELIGKELQLPVSGSFDKWLDDIMENSSETAEDQQKFPVKRLYEFFKNGFRTVASGQVVLDTTIAEHSSDTLRSMQPVDALTIKSYLRHWKSIGYLST